ncbi:hypothetical protein [Bradyrhizobium ottawaense]|uniref:hypothetical protein n=1 Tax=Bradyrhizobium ottawaense TaxID=931866 RepID=UPI003221721B
MRITADALLDSAKVRIVIGIAFGDAVEPGLLEMVLSVLHDLPAQHLRASAREMVIAEKFQAMVMLGAPIFVVLAGYHQRGYLRALAHAAVIHPR